MDPLPISGGYGISRLMSPETRRRTGHRSRSRRVREEVDLGQIHVPARGFDIVDEMVAPVGGGSSGGAESPGPLSQEYGESGLRSGR